MCIFSISCVCVWRVVKIDDCMSDISTSSIFRWSVRRTQNFAAHATSKSHIVNKQQVTDLCVWQKKSNRNPSLFFSLWATQQQHQHQQQQRQHWFRVIHLCTVRVHRVARVCEWEFDASINRDDYQWKRAINIDWCLWNRASFVHSYYPAKIAT